LVAKLEFAVMLLQRHIVVRRNGKIEWKLLDLYGFYFLVKFFSDTPMDFGSPMRRHINTISRDGQKA
jgi:hypothetical protein